MSYGNSGSGASRGHSHSSSSFGGKGASSSKKERKRKQEFHRHKIKYVEEERIDFAHLKERVVTSLNKLGQQVFSAEPGGYTLQDWMKSFNFLLDDFEEKVGPTNLPKEYFLKRQELSAELLRPVDTSDLDQLVEQVRREEEEIKARILEHERASRQKLDEERRITESKIGSLKKERESSLLEIEKEKQDSKKRETEKPPSLFRRLFSRSSSANSVYAREGSSSYSSYENKRINELEAKANNLQNEIHALRDENESRVARAESVHRDRVDEELERLEALRLRLGELESDRAQRLQLSERRQQVTVAMAEMISKVSIESSKAVDAGSSAEH